MSYRDAFHRTRAHIGFQIGDASVQINIGRQGHRHGRHGTSVDVGVQIDPYTGQPMIGAQVNVGGRHGRGHAIPAGRVADHEAGAFGPVRGAGRAHGVHYEDAWDPRKGRMVRERVDNRNGHPAVDMHRDFRHYASGRVEPRDMPREIHPHQVAAAVRRNTYYHQDPYQHNFYQQPSYHNAAQIRVDIAQNPQHFTGQAVRAPVTDNGIPVERGVVVSPSINGQQRSPILIDGIPQRPVPVSSSAQVGGGSGNQFGGGAATGGGGYSMPVRAP